MLFVHKKELHSWVARNLNFCFHAKSLLDVQWKSGILRWILAFVIKRQINYLWIIGHLWSFTTFICRKTGQSFGFPVISMCFSCISILWASQGKNRFANTNWHSNCLTTMPMCSTSQLRLLDSKQNPQQVINKQF